MTRLKFKNIFFLILIIVLLVFLLRSCCSCGSDDCSEKDCCADSGNEVCKGKLFSSVIDSTHTGFYDANGKEKRNRIFSVPDFSETFPDSNNVQLASAKRYGVKEVENRKDAESRMKELVYIGANPYYNVDKLKSSIPYLVPRAAVLLNDIGRSFFDSLQVKRVPLHQLIVTSVLRSKEDVAKLRNRNHNATANSCHLYGTTFDVCYNRYVTVSDPDKSPRNPVRNDTLKWVLSEVLRDMRQSGRCYIKYEVKQGCFHITVR